MYYYNNPVFLKIVYYCKKWKIAYHSEILVSGTPIDCFNSQPQDGRIERNIYEEEIWERDVMKREKQIGKKKVGSWNPGHHSSGHLG